jgi:hypothetical protein
MYLKIDNHMKDIDTIVNEIVLNTSYILEAKVEKLLIFAQCDEDAGRLEDANKFKELAKEIMETVELIRENEGCWA